MRASVSDSLCIRQLAERDLSFADQVRALAGWNQTVQDWERFLALQPAGCFLAEWQGTPAGTATTTIYDSTLAWIGMVLVHPDYRRRGIGQALLRHCIRFLHDRGLRCIKLDATPAGRPVYESLGFQTEWTLTRWMGAPSPQSPTHANPTPRPWRSVDLPAITSLDAKAFGVVRQRLFETLIPQSLAAQVAEDASGRLQGFGLLRPGSRAHYLGPVIASSQAAGLEVVASLLTHSEGHEVYWDIPDRNLALVSWAEHQGWTRQRPLTRMFLGQNTADGEPGRQIALSGPETG